jgi:hypothetical protein
MNPELDRKLRYLRLSEMAAALEARSRPSLLPHSRPDGRSGCPPQRS